MKTVLVVEDDDDAREVMGFILGRAGFRVTEAANGLEALHAIEHAEAQPNLVLLDLMMPLLSGAEVLRTLRANRATVALPVIVISAIADRHRPAGANAYLQKPVAADQLIAAVEALVA